MQRTTRARPHPFSLRAAFPLVLILLLAVPTLAAEERSHPLEARLTDGEAVWLEPDDAAAVFAISRAAAREKARGGILLLAGVAEHPDAPGVIGPLRRDLADHGWLTLALERAPDGDSGPRIAAGLDWLREQLGDEAEKLVIIGHGRAGTDTLIWLDQREEVSLHALVLVNIDLPTGEPEQAALASLEGLERPVLDLYYRGAPSAVVATAAERQRSARRAGNDHYRQDILPTARPGQGTNDALLRRIRGWLEAPDEKRETRRPATRSEEGVRREVREPTERRDRDDLQRYFTPPQPNR